jgi:hypothetical protein
VAPAELANHVVPVVEQVADLDLESILFISFGRN